MDMRTFWETKVEKNPDKVFLYYGDEEFTYNEVDAKVNQVANGFVGMGVEKGDKVCFMLRNVPEFLYSWFGLAKIGGVMVPVNTAFKANEAQYVVNHSEASCLIASQDTLHVALEIQKDCPHLKWIVCVDEDRLPQRVIPYSQLSRSMPKELKDFGVRDETITSIIYTSGTTGFPKGVVHVQKDLVLTGETFLLRAGVGPDDRIMTILPLFHLNAQFYSTWGAIAAEASLILIPQFSASRFWEQAVQYGATEFNFIGAVGKILCVRDRKEFRPEHSIRTAVGASVSPDVYETFTKEFKIPNVIDGYGLSEIPAVCQNPIGGKIKMKSMGLPAKHPDPSITFSEMKVMDDKGQEVPLGEIGELVVRNPAMMKEYLKEPEITRETIREGWLYTGDLGYKDEDGYYFFVSRKKDIIRRGGENISAAEVEGVLNENPKVFESAAIAVPSELGEDEVLVFTVLRPNQTMTPEEVIDWCKTHLAAFKVPRYIQFRDELPKTTTERVQKHSLREEKDLIEKAYDMASYKSKP
ncbi:MAG: AMP-binding protein [Pseudomonadota bacterium]